VTGALAARLATPFLVVAFAAGCVTLPDHQQLASLPGPHAALPATDAVSDGRGRFRDIFCQVLDRDRAADAQRGRCSGWLWSLGDEPPAEQRPLPVGDRAPQIYLVSGALSECLGDHARPFNDAATALRDAGYRIEPIVVSGRSGSEYNARQIAERVAGAAPEEAGPVVLIGYSKGANDILEFLVRYPDLAARVEAVVSVAGAIGGSPVAAQAAGVYGLLLDRIPNARCPPGDGKLLESLTGPARRAWLAQNPLPGHVQYYSLAAFTTRERMAMALVPVWRHLLSHDQQNDGQLLARDALIPGSTLLGYPDADHWSVALDVETPIHSRVPPCWSRSCFSLPSRGQSGRRGRDLAGRLPIGTGSMYENLTR
jgi:hypothetical protein